MIIHLPTFQIQEDTVHISARIELQTLSSKKKKFPQELWFKFPKKALSQLYFTPGNSDSFVVALLLLAMQNNETITIQGTLSYQLYQGLHEYQKIFHSWYPDRFHLVKIQASELLLKPSKTKEKAFQRACAFSGGVDSFYTLLSLPNVNSALFMSGFDMPLHLHESIQELVQSYSTLMKEQNIEFIAGSTNIRQFVNSVDWTNAHGQALIATALFFQNTWSEFYIPSSYMEKRHPKWGSHPELDYLLSTESLKIIHHGKQSNRVKKLEKIIQHPESFNRLRVCWIQSIGLKNCNECEKCIRTMIALKILGKLEYYTTFDEKLLTGKKIRNFILRTYQSRLFAQELIYEALKKKKYSIAFNLSYSLIRRKIFFIFNKYL